MKVRAERDVLKKALAAVLPAVDKRGSLPVLGGVRIAPSGEGVEVCCTDLSLTVTASCPAKCEGDDIAIVPAPLLARIVGAMPAGAVELELVDGRLSVSCGETTATLHCFDLSGWPASKVVEGEPVTLTERDVHQLARVARFASIDEKRQGLCGVFLSGHEALASDSYRLCSATLDAEVPGEVLIRAETVAKLAKAVDGPVSLTVGDKVARLAHGGTTWSTTLIEDDFPADMCRSFLAKPTSHRWTFSDVALAEAITRTNAITTEEPVRITVEGGKARVYRAKVDLGDVCDVIPVESDVDLTLGFNPQFLAQLVEAAEVDELTIDITGTDGLKPVTCRSEGFAQILMPVAGTVAKAR